MKKLIIFMAMLVSPSFYLQAEETKEETKSYLNNFYITAGFSKSLKQPLFEEEKDDYTELYLSNKINDIDNVNYLFNLGIGYNINPYFSVEFNYKGGSREEDYDTDDDYYLAEYRNKDYNNSSNFYVMYLVGNLPLQNQRFTPFIKLGLGYSQYQAKTYNVVSLRGDNANYDKVETIIDMNDISYHIQLGTNINIYKNHGISLYLGGDYLPNATKNITSNQTIINNTNGNIPQFSSSKSKIKNNNLFNSTIGINYVFNF